MRRKTLASLALPGLLAISGALGLGGCVAAGVGAGAAAGSAAMQERGISGALDDTQIRVEINHLWLQADETLHREVSMQVQEGRVLLTGVVPDPEMRLRAVKLAWQASGVREVINEIEVAGAGSVEGFARDTWISAQLKSRILFDDEISSVNYSIETVRGVVYLMGVAQSRAELDRVVDHARNLAHVRQVTSYVRVKKPDAVQPDASGGGGAEV